MNHKHSAPTFEVRAQPEGVITGYASVFDGVDSYGDSIVPGAYAQTLRQHKAAGTAPVMLWSHATNLPIGKWESLAEDRRGLQVSGRLNLKTGAGRDAFEHLRAGDVSGLSIGYEVPPGGRETRGDVSYLKSVSLHEISIVTLPADGSARVTSVKQVDERPETVRDFEKALRMLGYSQREAKQIAAHGFVGMTEADPSDEIAEALKAATQLFTKA